MTQVSSAGPSDQALVHHFIRTFGRRPSAEELARYELGEPRPGMCLGSRARRRAAQAIVRLGAAHAP